MLVLTRKLNEQIKIGSDITLTVIKVKGKAVRLGIEAPKQIRIARAELSQTNSTKSIVDKENCNEGTTHSTVSTQPFDLSQSRLTPATTDLTAVEPDSQDTRPSCNNIERIKLMYVRRKRRQRHAPLPR